MNYDREISRDQIDRAVQIIEPSWRVAEATPAADGHHVVYHLDVETETGHRECVLKGTPPGKPPACGDEARMLAILDAYTSLPVPEVYGVIDERDGLPTPLFLASTLPGTNPSRTDVAGLSEAAFERIARSTGRHLADLHALEAVDAYGFVDVEAAETLDGARPCADLDRIAVADPVADWREYVASSAEEAVAGLEATRFADVESDVRPVLEARIDALSGEFEPVVARIDQSLDNSLVDPETDEVSGLLDWEFCVAATPAYDLAFVEHSLSDGIWSAVPGVPDYRETVRAGLLEGYHEAGDPRVLEQFHDNYGCYALLAEVHAMLNFDDWFDLIDAPDDQREAAAAGLRRRVEEVIE